MRDPPPTMMAIPRGVVVGGGGRREIALGSSRSIPRGQARPGSASRSLPTSILASPHRLCMFMKNSFPKGGKKMLHSEKLAVQGWALEHGDRLSAHFSDQSRQGLDRIEGSDFHYADRQELTVK